MAKNLWIAGQSGNPEGKKTGTRHSARTIKGRIERFLGRNMSAKALQTMFSKLPEKEQAQMLVALLPFVLPRQSMEAMSSEQIDTLYDRMMEGLNKSKQSTKNVVFLIGGAFGIDQPVLEKAKVKWSTLQENI